ncbi:unnamed protein product [Euphydryas editha]|uniref:Uncharacterized protein n=1 Tax=Euphydryas editha TaxID=104508 RepID=A0AAU9TLM4_EUPED|nr:unnamed protein product [Euphydryas editha]
MMDFNKIPSSHSLLLHNTRITLINDAMKYHHPSCTYKSMERLLLAHTQPITLALRTDSTERYWRYSSAASHALSQIKRTSPSRSHSTDHARSAVYKSRRVTDRTRRGKCAGAMTPLRASLVQQARYWRYSSAASHALSQINRTSPSRSHSTDHARSAVYKSRRVTDRTRRGKCAGAMTPLRASLVQQARYWRYSSAASHALSQINRTSPSRSHSTDHARSAVYKSRRVTDRTRRGKCAGAMTPLRASLVQQARYWRYSSAASHALSQINRTSPSRSHSTDHARSAVYKSRRVTDRTRRGKCAGAMTPLRASLVQQARYWRYSSAASHALSQINRTSPSRSHSTDHARSAVYKSRRVTDRTRRGKCAGAMTPLRASLVQQARYWRYSSAASHALSQINRTSPSRSHSTDHARSAVYKSRRVTDRTRRGKCAGAMTPLRASLVQQARYWQYSSAASHALSQINRTSPSRSHSTDHARSAVYKSRRVTDRTRRGKCAGAMTPLRASLVQQARYWRYSSAASHALSQINRTSPSRSHSTDHARSAVYKSRRVTDRTRRGKCAGAMTPLRASLVQQARYWRYSSAASHALSQINRTSPSRSHSTDHARSAVYKSRRVTDRTRRGKCAGAMTPLRASLVQQARYWRYSSAASHALSQINRTSPSRSHSTDHARSAVYKSRRVTDRTRRGKCAGAMTPLRASLVQQARYWRYSSAASHALSQINRTSPSRSHSTDHARSAVYKSRRVTDRTRRGKCAGAMTPLRASLVQQARYWRYSSAASHALSQINRTSPSRSHSTDHARSAVYKSRRVTDRTRRGKCAGAMTPLRASLVQQARYWRYSSAASHALSQINRTSPSRSHSTDHARSAVYKSRRVTDRTRRGKCAGAMTPLRASLVQQARYWRYSSAASHALLSLPGSGSYVARSHACAKCSFSYIKNTM